MTSCIFSQSKILHNGKRKSALWKAGMCEGENLFQVAREIAIVNIVQILKFKDA